MLAVEDCLDALDWVARIGGVSETIARSTRNLDVIEEWISKSEWAGFLPQNPLTRSQTSICLRIIDPWFNNTIAPEAQTDFIKNHIIKPLEAEKVAYDIASYRDAPTGLRIWGGATVDAGDLMVLTNWLDWAYYSAKQEINNSKAA
jgi:phosphoserine aminotransferase